MSGTGNSCDITVVKPAFELFEKTVGRVLGKSVGPYRWCDYVVETECEEGTLLWSTLSGALILMPCRDAIHRVSPEVGAEGCTIREGDAMNRVSTLLGLGFVVPVGFDEWRASEQLRSLCGSFARGEMREWGFTVFTTLACNARCPYCFEKGMAEEMQHSESRIQNPKSLHMSKVTAEAVADFIADRAFSAMADGYGHGSHPDGKAIAIGHSHSQAPQVRLSWFGGEPMMNPMAIETICGGLEKRGVEWRSDMTTNGVLFDPELVRHAVERWRLEGIQVTLDGREEEYNRVKGIRLCGGESAYGRVMRNIGLLAEAGVRVTVRLNLSLENAQELMLLAEELQPMRGVSVYCHPLFEYYEPGREDEADEVFARYKALNQRLAERGLLQPTAKLPSHFKLNHCEADSDTRLLILPDGSLGKCQNQHSLLSVGDIERGVSDPVRVAYFRQRQKSAARCRRCHHAPLCLLPECCDDRCGRLYLLKENDLISRQMRAELRRFRAGKGEGEENLFSCV